MFTSGCGVTVGVAGGDEVSVGSSGVLVEARIGAFDVTLVGVGGSVGEADKGIVVVIRGGF